VETVDDSGKRLTVTPEFEGKLECINYMCVRIKLHTRNDSVNTKTVSKAYREYYNIIT
jgi:hypothetical protein